MNTIKNITILLSFLCAIPTCYAQDNTITDNTIEAQESQPIIDYKLEDACSTKLALAGLAIPCGIVAGIATIKANPLLAASLGIAPIALYVYLYKKYQHMFDKERFDWVLTHAIEDKALDYGMLIFRIPLFISLFVYNMLSNGAYMFFYQ